jgi:hypothetical protein
LNKWSELYAGREDEPLEGASEQDLKAALHSALEDAPGYWLAEVSDTYANFPKKYLIAALKWEVRRDCEAEDFVRRWKHEFETYGWPLYTHYLWDCPSWPAFARCVVP